MARRTTAANHQDPAPPSSRASAVSGPSTQGPPASVSAAASPAPRTTRSSARLAAAAADSAASSSVVGGPAAVPPGVPASSRKRKAPARRDQSHPDVESPSSATYQTRRSKRQRTTASGPRATSPVASPTTPAPTADRRRTRSRSAMSPPGSSSRPHDQNTRAPASSSSSTRRRSSRNGKPGQETAPSSVRRQKKRSPKLDPDIPMPDADEPPSESESQRRPDDDYDDPDETASSPRSESNDGTNQSGRGDDEDGDPFRSNFFRSPSPFGGLQHTLRALSGMMTGVSARLRDILSSLRMKEDPSMQLIALQDLSDLLLVSNEDNLSGQFSPDPFVKELVALMQPNEFGEENPEIMLLACRCLANLMEALRGSVANVVYGGAVPVLCQKLLDIQFIDLAEQALSTLHKISVDFPASIVREGGLTACLTYLDFFPTSTQRTAVTTAANCCRNLPSDSFPVVRDVMPTLLNVLSSNDQKVVEQACLCVSRIVESFKHRPEKLEQLIEPAMLRAILRLLLPGATNLIGPDIHTQFLRVLGYVARASPRLSAELLKMDVVDTLYQILTGVSAPRGEDNKVDNVVTMQALVHRPREQVYETLNVICELLPAAEDYSDALNQFDRLRVDTGPYSPVRSSSKAKETAEQRRQLLQSCKAELKRFAVVLFPTLTDAYSSTVNQGVRQKVLLAQLKMLQNIDADVIEESIRNVPYASFLAAILSQKDHPTLVFYALQCAELLFVRLPSIYQYQFHREGVISQIMSIAEQPLSKEANNAHPPTGNDEDTHSQHSDTASPMASEDSPMRRDASPDSDDDDEDDEDDREGQDYPDEDDDDGHDRDEDDTSDSEDSGSFPPSQPLSFSVDVAMNDAVTRTARGFLQRYNETEGTKALRDRASKILADLQELASGLTACYAEGASSDALGLFQKLASYFEHGALDNITSSELLTSGVIDVLLDIFNKPDTAREARTTFLQAFMGKALSDKARGAQASPATPFSVLIRKLHDLLSRTEHFEVITVGHNSLENTRSNAAHMLGRQVRLKLVADDESDIPRPYKHLMVSIHAIATFKSLDDFLRPRISLSDRPRAATSGRDFLSMSRSGRIRDDQGSSGRRSANNESSSSTALAQSSAGSQPGDRRAPSSTSRSTAQRRSSGSGDRRTGTRRSSRNQSSNMLHSEESRRFLECADERRFSDEEDEDDEGEEEPEDHSEEDDEELNAIVDDLEEEAGEDRGPESGAVNMEVAATGKVTARKEDGTRVSTPSHSQSQTPSKGLSSAASSQDQNYPASGSSSAGPSGGRSYASYAAAMASIPQDWHIEFRVGGEVVTNETTIYRAIYRSMQNGGEESGGSVWSTVHTVRFRRVPGPPPPEPSSLSTGTKEDTEDRDEKTGLPRSLSQNPITASILRLLRFLHEINAHLDDLMAENRELVGITPEPPSQFVNTKLTAKLNRQLEEPLIVASGCLPSWSEDLAREFPFLFPFETRHLFLQSTAFGYARAMMRWQNSQPEDGGRDQRRDDRPFFGRLQRQKVRISRSRILESAMKVMELYGSSPSILEVEYFEEVGTGLGPTLEFYSTVSREFSKKKLKLWRENDSEDNSEFVTSKNGLFPAPMSDEQAETEAGKRQLQLFKTLGKFVARSMLDSRIIDINFNPTFFRLALSPVKPSLGTVRTVDPDLANSLLLVKRFANGKKRIEDDHSLSAEQRSRALQDIEIDGVRVEDLGLDFTLPGYPSIELIPNGANTAVTIDNVDQYVDRVVDLTLGSGVQRQLDAFRSGFSSVFPFSALRAFTPNELVMLFGQVEEDWSMETLMDSIKADHGFNMDSKSVRNLLQAMTELNKQQRRDFLQFVTGSPKLPIGGFKSLTPMFTVVCRPSEPPYTSDDYLPSVMTCVNYLKLPDYSSLEVLRERLIMAIQEGQGAFHLS